MPRKVNILVWRVLMDRIPTMFNLSSSRIDVSLILCPICELHVKQLHHLFVRCDVTVKIWDEMFVWLELDRIDFESIQ